MSVVVAAFSLGVAMVLAWAAAAKGVALSRGRGDELVDGLGRFIPYQPRRWVVVGVIVAESSTALLLLYRPLAGLVAATLLFAVFLALTWTLPVGKPCNCFGGALEFGGSAAARRIRNGLLLTVSIGTLVAAQFIPPDPDASAVAIAVGIMLIAYTFDILLNASRRAGLREQI